jgi:hypothetical protein
LTTFEPVRKGNPYQLTVDQHFYSAHSISKFYGDDSKVEVMDLHSGDTYKRHKRAKLFCTKRTWDQRAESGNMVNIENDFHAQIDHLKPYKKCDHEAISMYFFL